MVKKLADLSEAELRAAWEDRRKLGWPHDFETSMAHATLSRLIRMHAVHGMHPHRDRRGDANAVQPSPVMKRHRGLIEPGPRILDGKSLAAGERDDD